MRERVEQAADVAAAGAWGAKAPAFLAPFIAWADFASGAFGVPPDLRGQVRDIAAERLSQREGRGALASDLRIIRESENVG